MDHPVHPLVTYSVSATVAASLQPLRHSPRRCGSQSITFGRALLDGVHRLDAPTDAELRLALVLADRYVDSGVGLPDLTVMAMASIRDAWILTWDYRDFRSVVLDKGHHWDLLVQESELPQP